MSVSERLEQVLARIATATAQAGRAAGSVRLLAVSKFHPPEVIREAYAAGQREFGENYVQELDGKLAALADLPELRFHLIGHLQRNKARRVAALAAGVDSVDSAELARELGRRAELGAEERSRRFGLASRLRVLVEVSIAGEAQKGGVAEAELSSVLSAVEQEAALELRGLMCVPPLGSPEATRPYFDRLVALRDAHGGPGRLPELSMGMTSDLEQAIAAGATVVRVGTAIFGERPPPSA